MMFYWIIGLLLTVSTHRLLADETTHGGIELEAARNLDSDAQWVHQRSTLSLDKKLPMTQLGGSEILWGGRFAGFYRYDKALPNREQNEWRPSHVSLGIYGNGWSSQIGWQTVSWGETLGPSLVDLANPRDLRDASAWLLGDQSLAAPMLTGALNHENLVAEFWLSPSSPHAKLPEHWLKLPLIAEDRQDSTEFGARAGGLWAGWDIKLYVLQHASRLPAIRLQTEADTPTLRASFPEQRSIGLTLSQSLQNLVLRAEALQTHYKIEPQESRLAMPVEQFTIGLDSSHEAEFWLGTEVRLSQNISAQTVDQNSQWIIVQTGGNFFDGHFKPRLYTAQRLDLDENFWRIQLASELAHGFESRLAWEQLRGESASLLGTWQVPALASIALSWDF